MDLPHQFKSLKTFFQSRKVWIIAGAVGLTAISALAIFASTGQTSFLTASAASEETKPALAAFPIVQPTLKWGFAVDTL
ncbi:MAG: hypothetical protein KDC54_03725, partial [Lewinella sp.]|nr:hypothetical protein [Lewinella sp.]